MEQKIKKDYSKKILVISNNPFSEKQNNGKTLLSFFENYPIANIAQLYFNPMNPDTAIFNNYYKISDMDILKKILRFTKSCGKRVSSTVDTNATIIDSIPKIYKNHLTRWIREIMWNTGVWKTKELYEWIVDFRPDVVFFLAGDSFFAYKITEYILKLFNVKLIVYITDDYILSNKILPKLERIKRFFLKKKMKEIITKSDIFYTISHEMGEVYEKIFLKKSNQLVNIPNSLYSTNSTNDIDNEIISLVYVGGLHFNRDATLTLLANAIKRFNNLHSTKKAFLKIYSTQKISDKLSLDLNINQASKFCGGLQSNEVSEVLNQCDIPVHVESFNDRSIVSTLLSISTKIPEYLSLRKCILAIGPSEISSMKYLEDCAYCITNVDTIGVSIENLFINWEQYKDLSNRSYEKYLKFHLSNVVTEELYEKINAL